MKRGRPPHPDVLTPAEWEVLEKVRHGMTNRQIAKARGTSLEASKYHVANILGKLGLRDRQEVRHWRGRAAASTLKQEWRKPAMPSSVQLGTIGQISLPVADIEEAEHFYRDVLGIPHLFSFGNLAFFDCGGTRLFCTAESEGSEKRASVIYFRVQDIDGVFEHLRASGVTFRGVPHLIHRHEDGTEEWMAFFDDPFGNLLALMAQVRPG